MKKLFIASTSTVHGSGYLEYLLSELKSFFYGVNEILFIPYARPSGISYDDYTQIVSQAFKKIGINVTGIHQFADQVEALEDTKGIFVGGGNTFVLVNELYEQNLMGVLEARVSKGIPYLGTSAGSNICGISMQTTNDMPIVYPSTFLTLGFLPFNINAHYLDPDLTSKHKGETRETRIKEFHTYNDTPVLGLREGSWLEVDNDNIVLKGKLQARLFQQNKEPIELALESKLRI